MSTSSRRRSVALSLPVVCLLLAAAGCAGGPANRPAGERAAGTAALPGTPGCFWLRNFEGSWTALNQRELLVYAPLSSPPYLVQLFAPVPTLQFAERLGFEDVERTGMICNNAQDDVIIPNWTPHRVPITAVRQLTRPEARALMQSNGLKVPADKARS